MRKSIFNLLTLFLSVSLAFTACSEENDKLVTGVSLNVTTLELTVGKTSQLTATVLPETAENKNVAWSSSNTAIATVSETGLVTAVKIGTAAITATTAEGAKTAVCNLTVGAKPAINVTGNIAANTTWTADKVYILDGPVYVKESATLTIEPGTLIKGKKASVRPALIIERGAKIMANGTKELPIVFTSDQPKGQRASGDWGGIIICGKAKINVVGGEAEIEGGIGSKYGGTDDNDNSGTMRYVRIEFPGIPFEPNKEINGLTLGGVGKGTILEYIQVSFSGDDSFEWFGGSVNAKYIVAHRGIDDDFDTDYGYSGYVQYAVSLRDPNLADAAGDSNGFESDNDSGGSTNTPFTSATFSNVSVFGPVSTPEATYNAKYNTAARLRRNTQLKLHNMVFAGFPYGLLIEGPSQAAYTAGSLVIKNSILGGNKADYKDDTYLESTVFENADNANRKFATNDALMLNSPYNLTAPNFMPKSGSPLLSGASFTGLPAFFKAETFVGAFGLSNWTEGWTNFDPQNTDY
ncbi:MAG TPA: hypothetical protein DCQ31_10810 [Bacteroidales bacterium]|nr:hypothetical protein [Bacteroidales bacterium]